MQSGTAGHNWIRVHVGKQFRAARGNGDSVCNAAHSQVVFRLDRKGCGRKQHLVIAVLIKAHLFIANCNAVADEEVCAELLVAALAAVRKILRAKQDSGFPAVAAFAWAEVRMDFCIREANFPGLLE